MIETDTIAAISTPIGEGAISIVRLSGPESIDNCKSTLFKGKNLHEVDHIRFIMGKLLSLIRCGY